MKNTLKKIFCALSFLPYGIIFFCGVREAFSAGCGMSGFVLGAFSAMADMIIVPVLPACIVFHYACIIEKALYGMRNAV